MIAIGNLHVGDRVLVKFAVAAVAIDPAGMEPSFVPALREVWKERRVLGIEKYCTNPPRPNGTVRVLSYHLQEPIDVPVEWLREVPTS